MRQLSLLKTKKYKHRKVIRGISTQDYNHVILKARLPVLRVNYRLVGDIIEDGCQRYGIQILSAALLDNHIHLLIRTPARKAFQDALRFIAGKIAREIGKGKLWEQRVWSRVTRYGKDYGNVRRYIEANPGVAGVFDEVDVWFSKLGTRESSK